MSCSSQAAAIGPTRPRCRRFSVVGTRAPGHQGITLRAGTWHHALLALDGADFVVLERLAAQVDCEIAMLPQAVSIVLA